MSAAEHLNPPSPPEEVCEFCQKPVEFRLNPDWERMITSGVVPKGVIARLCFERVSHHECIEKERLKAKREAERDHYEKETERRQGEFDEWYGNATFPLDVKNRTFETFKDNGQNADALKLLKNWREGDDFGFLLYGPAGTGKSHLGFSLMRVILDGHLKKLEKFRPWNEPAQFEREGFDRRRLPHYESVASLLSKLRGTSGELSPRVMDSSTLFLDDLGAESITEWSREIFFRLFDHRLNRRLPVIVTSNLSLNELKDRMHERVVSRMLGLCVPLEIKGDDRRRLILADRVKRLKERSL